MYYPSCPRCGALLFESDRGVCPRCPAEAVEPDWVEEQHEPEPVVEEAAEHDMVVLEDIAPALPPLPPGDGELYATVRHVLRSPAESRQSRLGLLGLSLGLFVMAQGQGERSWTMIAMAVGVVFFHELGHWLGMRWFGYQDVRIFFIPFFGGAASGQKDGAAQWQQAIVLLLGPLPGIIVGGVLLWGNLHWHSHLVQMAGLWFVAVNAFNLLPLVPLDGGRLLNLLIFSRHRALEAFFLVATSLGVVGVGALIDAKLLMGLGVLGVIMAPAQYRTARTAAALRARWPVLPPRVADADECVLRDVFGEVRKSWRAQQGPNLAPMIANAMKTVYEKAAIRPVSLGALFGLLTVYASGFVLTAAALVAMVLDHPAQQGPLP